MVAATPTFFGATPAEVRQGPRQGLRTLADVEDWPNRIKAVQPADVRRVAQAHLLKEESVTGRMQPRP